MKRKLITAVCMMCLGSMLTGCTSYMEMEDSLKSNIIEEQVEKNEENETETEWENKADVSEETTAGIGDTIEFTDIEGKIMQYTLEDVKIVTNLNEVGLSTKEFAGGITVGEDGCIEDAEENSLIVITVKVKNINIDLENVEEEYPLCIEMCAGNESNIKNPDGPFMLEANYFSKHPDGLNEYYMYYLEKGEEMEAKIAWLVPNDLLEEPFYWVIGNSYSTEYFKFFQLNKETGK